MSDRTAANTSSGSISSTSSAVVQTGALDEVCVSQILFLLFNKVEFVFDFVTVKETAISTQMEFQDSWYHLRPK